MTAKVPSPPSLVDQFTDQQYARRYAKAMQIIGIDLATNTLPPTGARITAVYPNSPGAVASLQIDDVIVAIDGKPTPTADAARAAHRAAMVAQTLELFSLDNPNHRFVKIDPGYLGIDVDDGYLLEGEYLHDLPTGVAPVDEVRVAARFAVSDPLFAESAIVHAKKVGGPATSGPIVDAIAAVAFFNDDWFENALAYAMSASKSMPRVWRAQMNQIIIDSAIATFRFPLAKTVAQADTRYPLALATATAEMAIFQQKKHTIAEPNPAAAKLSFIDRTEGATNFAPQENFENSNYRVWYMTNHRAIPFDAPDSSFDVCESGPGDANVVFSARCHFVATDGGNSGTVKLVRIGIVNAEDRVRLTELELYVDGSADVTANEDAPAASLNLKRLIAGGRQFGLEMAVVGDRYEFTIDGRRIFYGPLPAIPPVEKRKLMLFIQAVGVTGDFTDVKWATARPS